MTQATVDKIKHMINKVYAARFSVDVVNQLTFIPICEQKGVFFAAVTNESKKAEIESIISSSTNFKTKFIPLSNEAYATLKNYYFSEIIDNEPKAEPVATPPPAPIQANVTEPQPSATTQQEKPRKRLGDILKDGGYITEAQLIEALAFSKNTGVPLGSALVEKKYISTEVLKEVLQEQLGTEAVASNELQIQPAVLKLLSVDFIKTNKVIPLASDGKSITVGMVNPNDKKTINAIMYMTGGLRVQTKLLTHIEYKRYIDEHYGQSYRDQNEYIKNIEKEALELDIEEDLSAQVERELQDKSGNVAKFVNKIVTDAIDQRVSDIHIEPRLDGYVVRYRADGILKQVLSLPAKVESAVITRFKVLSKMDIAEFRRPQDGTFTITHNNISYDFRINTLPVGGREKMVIRVLAPAQTLSSSDREIRLQGATEREHEIIKKMTTAPNGIILASGPTGSGKTTTLYSILKSVNDPTVNITTIEDPVEIKIDGINQSQINAKAGITFASCMRAILRQDPDIILVGEIRDLETLEVAISAALTGHLVLSTIHTNSAATTVTRLIEMGAKDYLVSSTLTGVIAQRLVRHLCPHCKEAYHASLEETKQVILNPEDYDEFMSKTIYKPKGCPECNYEGYKGRIGVYEILPINKEIKKLIAQGAHDIEIEDAAVGAGMRTLQQCCMGHLLRGETTITEFVRVLGMANE